ncbi:Ribosomal 50S subunit-recycling heat shock protein, contains S4 domain [Amphibacillus marinus]|uniref:RQC P-site tRNA stabilizing factor n=1 Tax=Amphibacillus marinus TaxID=872970 RepID=A0A1H8TM06_9BACI|nr:RNA-binding S4 domain-containing protein [Amphibacillus marinus]SEO91992.1 Ribosomal 50S subunit-recycling heat shock protein, contains S4 domain [Amphibacillus marinus]
MRLDKFLKVSRLIKRRTLAKEVADQGRIKVNGNQAKAATTVSIDDELDIQFGQKLLTIKIESLKETVRKEEANTLYSILKEVPVSKDNN